jgi:dTDP-4-amino-4,6-dideoxygalactose transaminase
MQQCFAYLGYEAQDCPESARAAQETLALPVYPELSERQLRHVVESVLAFFMKV